MRSIYPNSYNLHPQPGRTDAHYDGQPVDPTNWTHPPFEPTFYTAAMEAGGEPRMFPEEGEAVRCPVKELHMNRPLAISDGVTLPAGST